MKALTFHGKETIKYETVADPKIVDSTDVIVKILCSAICGSDLHLYHEREPGLDHGTVMGHEFIGEIVETGKDIKKFRKGDQVMSPFSINCGKCFFCQKGLTCRCVKSHPFGWVHKGKGLQGVQAEFARVPLADSTLLHLPVNISFDEGILLGDILSTGFFCATMAEVNHEGIYAIIGCGPVGLMTVIATKELGAKKIYAIDSISERLEQAELFGAISINYKEQDPIEIIKKATQERGADAVLELVGNPSAAKLAMQLLRSGGILSVVGVHTSEHFAFSPSDAYNKNLIYKTGRCPARFFMEKLIPIVQQKKYNFASVISHHLPLKDGVHGYQIFDKKLEKCTKVVLKNNHL